MPRTTSLRGAMDSSGGRWNWYTGADPSAIGAGQYDFRTIVTHELGHAIGLGHSGDTGSVMYPYLSAGEARHGVTARDMSVLEASDGTPEPLLAWHKQEVTSASPAIGNVVATLGEVLDYPGFSTRQAWFTSAPSSFVDFPRLDGARPYVFTAPNISPERQRRKCQSSALLGGLGTAFIEWLLDTDLTEA